MPTLVPRGYLTLNSEDRYPGGITPRDPSLQTTATNITYSIPALSSITNLQLVSLQIAGGQWNENVRAENYTNVINVIDYNIPSTFLITIPSGQNAASLTGTVLTNYIRAQLGDLWAIQGNYPLCSVWGGGVGAGPAYDFVGNVYPGSMTWVSAFNTLTTANDGRTAHNWGFAPVSSINGVNIGGYRQLYDMLGLVGHISSVGGVNTYFGSGGAGQSNTSNWGSAGYGGAPLQNYWTKFIDIASPQITGQPDLSSSPTAPSGLIARTIPTAGGASTWSLTAGTGSVSNNLTQPKIMTIPSGLSSFTLRMYDDKGRPLVPALSTVQPGQSLPLSSFNAVNNSTLVLYTSTFANFLTAGQPMTVSNTYAPMFYGNGITFAPTNGVQLNISSVSTTATNTAIVLNVNQAYSGISVNGVSGTSTLAWYNVGKVSSIGNMIGPEYTAQFAAYSSE